MKLPVIHRRFLPMVFMSAGLASIGLLGGLGLQAVKDELIAFTPLIIALPAMNAMAGDYATIVTAHVGDPETRKQNMKKLFVALGVSLPFSVLGVSAISLFIASIQGYILTGQFIQQFVLYIALALTGVVLVTLILISIINYILKKQPYSSDDVLIPLANTVASVLTLVSFAVIVTVLP